MLCVHRAGSLYGELARFVLRLLGYKAKDQQKPVVGPNEHSLPQNGHNSALSFPQQQQQHMPHAAMHAAPGPSNWDGVWQS